MRIGLNDQCTGNHRLTAVWRVRIDTDSTPRPSGIGGLPGVLFVLAGVQGARSEQHHQADEDKAGER